jgi:hypothetical protein
MSQPTPIPAAQPVSPLMHAWFLVDMLLVTIAGTQLFILTGATDRFFAWTIQSGLTAAFLGAAYFSTLPMLLHSFRARLWAEARSAVPGVWAFTLLTTIATLVYWGKFNWASPLLTARVAFWAWLVVYLAVPVGVALAWLVQKRVPGRDPARGPGLPLVLRLALAAQAALALLVGALLYALPGLMLPLWPWTLTPLTSAAVGAWLIGVGLTLAWMVVEADWRRVRGVLLTFALFGALQLIAVARYGGAVQWRYASTWLYLAFLLSAFAVSVVGYALSWLAQR